MGNKEALPLLALLLQYPESDWLEMNRLWQAANEIEHSLIRQNIHNFLAYIKSKAWVELAEEYVATFDFSECGNLYLTSLTCLDERKRGQVLVQLNSIYCQAGLEVDTGELPDYLPLVLEFLSLAGQELSDQILEVVGTGMEKLRQQLEKMHSPYAGLLEACLLSVGGAA